MTDKKEKDTEKDKSQDPLPVIHEKVTVTATMTSKAVRSCASSVSVLGEKELTAQFAGNALNLLSGLPGIFVQKTADFGRADVEIRGMGQRGQRIVIMTDGRPEKMGLFGCAVTHAFPLDNVERIEVVRGPASVLYGSDALGGVVNILTHTPGKGFQTDLQASYGSFNTWMATLRHGGAGGNWNYFFTLDRRASDGHMDNSGYSGYSGTFRGELRFNSHWKTFVQGKYFSGKKDEPDLLNLQGPGTWNDYQRGAVNLGLSGNWRKSEFQLHLFRDFGKHVFSDGWDSRDYVNGGVMRYTTRFSEGDELTLGADFRQMGGRILTSPAGEWKRDEWAFFAYDEWLLHSRWLLSGGFRLNHDSRYGWEAIPKIGLVWFPADKWAVRANVSKGFRSPQLNELYIFPSSNAELEPERVWNYEVGGDFQWTRNTLLRGAVFTLLGSNLIELAANESGMPKFKYRNTGRFHFFGVEMGIQQRFSDHVQGSLFYSYLNPEDKTRGRPGQKIDLGMEASGRFWNLNFHLQHVRNYYGADFSRLPLPSYFLLDSRLVIHLHAKIDFVLDLNNILDEDYYLYVDLPGTAAGPYPMPGRNIQAGVRVKL